MGGIITGVKRGIDELEANGYKLDGILEKRIKLGNETWRVLTVYNNHNLREIRNEIEENVKESEEDNLILGGDFNARIGDRGGLWENEKQSERKSKDKVINNEGKLLLDFIEERAWSVLNGNIVGDYDGEHTYIGPRASTTIDYVITNEKAREKVDSMLVGLRTESDHQPLEIKLTCEAEKSYQEENSAKTRQKLKVRWNYEDIEKYKKRMENMVIEVKNINDTVEDLTEQINNAITRTKVTWKERSVGSNKWWDRECREKKKRVANALRKTRKDASEKDKYLLEKREYRELCSLKKTQRREELMKEIKNVKSESDSWKYINRERKRWAGINDSISMDRWQNHFQNILQGSRVQAPMDIHLENIGQTEEKDKITEDEVRAQIAKLQKKKAAGSDGIPNEAWIYGGEKIVKTLSDIFRRVWNGEGFPEAWKDGIICPIFKKGDKEDTSNYRGITIANTMYKIYASILNEKLTQELEEKHLLPEVQAGFRRGRGTIDNIYTLKHVIDGELNKSKGKVYAFFADLTAAFDSINRIRLIEIIKSLGISKRMVNGLTEIYRETTCRVRVGERCSETFWTTYGIKQGCPLSANLFAIFIADLEETLKKGQDGGMVIGNTKIWSLSYADDVVLIAKSAAEMKEMLKRFKKYLGRKELQLNINKSKIMQFRKGGGRDKQEVWEWGKEKIEQVKEFVYLGYRLQRNGEDRAHIKQQCAKANIALKNIWSIGERNFKDDYAIRMMMFDYLVKSILLYGAEIWGWEKQQEIEKIQAKYIRWTLQLDRSTPLYILLEETKRDKLEIAAGKRAIKYEEKIRTNKEVIHLQQVWRKIRKGEEEGKWTKRTKRREEFYQSCGYSGICIEEGRERAVNVLKKTLERKRDTQRQEQFNNIQQSTFCPEYKDITTLSVPRYLMRRGANINIQKIARFRCGSGLRANRYWLGQEQRICRLCERQEETLRHLAYYCDKLTPERRSIQELLDDTGEGTKWMQYVDSKLASVK